MLGGSAGQAERQGVRSECSANSVGQLGGHAPRRRATRLANGRSVFCVHRRTLPDGRHGRLAGAPLPGLLSWRRRRPRCAAEARCLDRLRSQRKNISHVRQHTRLAGRPAGRNHDRADHAIWHRDHHRVVIRGRRGANEGRAGNGIVYAADESGKSVVAAMDPVEALQLTGNDAVRPIAEDVRSRLQRVLEAVERG